MNRPRRFAIAILIVIPIAASVYWQLTWVDPEEAGRFERGETELVVSNPGDATLSLYMAGRDLCDTTRVVEFDGKRIWLKAGRYFLHSADAGRTAFFPISLTGYRSGPDDDRTFTITVRPSPAELPPRLFNHLPGFMRIPSGYFLMGDRQNPREPHYVWLTSYFIAPYEVTNEEFREFIAAPDGYGHFANWTEQGKRWLQTSKSQSTALLKPGDPDYERFGQPDQPVVRVTWYEANAFCTWMSRKYADRKWQFSLPTDAEWEKAARGPDSFDYALGMSISDAEVELYNWKKNPDAAVSVFGIEATRRTFQPNRFGLYHMTGNVAEWTQSIDVPFNREHPFENDGRNHDEARGKRTARGGSWYSAATSYLYIPYRDSFQPEHSTQDIGFRIVARALP